MERCGGSLERWLIGEMWWLIEEMWWLIEDTICGGSLKRCGGSLERCGGSLERCGGSLERCGGSLVALQTTEAAVPGSNSASLTVENSEDRQSHCVLVYCKISGQRGRPPPRAKKI